MVYKSIEGKNEIRALISKIYQTKAPYELKNINIKTAAGDTHILRAGRIENPALFFLHGSTSNSSTWFGALQYFINDFCIYLIDIPGEPGLSDISRFNLASDIPALWLYEICEHFSIDQVSMISMSLGGWFSLKFASTFPEKVKMISLLTTCGIVNAKTGFIFKALFYMMLGKVGQRLLNNAIYYKASQIEDEDFLLFQNLINRHFKPLVEPVPIFSVEDLGKISCPVQYFGGTHDVILHSRKTAERLEKTLKHSEINILMDTGHVIIDKFESIFDYLVSQY